MVAHDTINPMIERYKDTEVAWVDLASPTPEEIRAVMEEFNIPPELLGDLTTPTPRSEARAAGHALKVTLDFPVVRRKDVETPHEIKFIVTKKALITVRYEEVTALHTFSKEFEVLVALGRGSKGTHGGFLFVALMSSLYNGLTAKLDYIESRLTFIEEEMFDEHEREMVLEISKNSQTLITFRQILFAHKEILNIAEPILLQLFDKAFDTRVHTLMAYHEYLSRRVDTLNASLQDLRETNNSLLSTKQNETMKILTVMAFVTYPLALVAAVFGMNTDHTPLVDGQYGFWIIVGLMSSAALCFFAYFKYKHWF